LKRGQRSNRASIRAVALENGDTAIEEILIVTNENHRFLILEQLEELKLQTKIRILLEPESKNTAPALTLATLAAMDTNPDSVMVVTPADHYVKNLNSFTEAMGHAINRVATATIFTLGIDPIRADTAFGYIKYAGDEVVKDLITLKENPSLEEAESFVKTGKYAWNAGIFILKPKNLDGRYPAIKTRNSHLDQQRLAKKIQ